MVRRLRKKFWLFAACASAALLSPPGAWAQSGTTTDEIVVTATRRESALQDVPIAVTPVTAELVRNAGIRDLQDLISVTPTLQFNVSENETSATARIRGIGTQGSNPGLESSVGVFIDGVYRARNGVALTDLGEISQIEILRGPQGTLFGRNTSAGLISIVTAGPDLGEFGAAGEVSIGDYNETHYSAHLTGPIIRDQLGFRLFAARGMREGLNDLVLPNGDRVDINDRDLWTVRGQLLFAPSNDFDLRLIADYSERDELCCAGVFYDPAIVNETTGEGYDDSPPAIAIAQIGGFGPDGLAALGAEGFSDRTAFANRPTTQNLTDSGVSGEANWETSLGLITAITAYRDWNFQQGQDIDFTAADLLYRAPGDGGFHFEEFTQELRLAGREGALDYLIGLYYSDETLRRRDSVRIGAQYGDYFTQLGVVSGNLLVAGAAPVLAMTEGGGQRDRYEQSGDTLSLFTHNIWAVSDRTDLTFGLRFTQGEKNFLGVRQTVGALPAPLNAFPWHNASLDGTSTDSLDEEEWSGVIAARHELSDQVSGYVSFAHGYKAGGFNLDREFDGDTSFAAELADTWEIGAKTAWFGGDLLLNAALFASEFENFQLNRFTGVTFIVNSIPEVTSRGAELDMIWRAPIEGLSMQGGLAYADAQYGDAGPWSAGGLARLPNARLTNAPLWTITNAVTYEWPAFNDALTGLAYLDFRYVSEQNTGSDLHPSKIQPAYVLVNGRIAFATPDERYAIELWGRNLLDEDYAQVMFDGPLQFLQPVVPISGLRGAFLGDPRTYGVTLRARY